MITTFLDRRRTAARAAAAAGSGGLRADRRVRVLIWALVAALACGVLGAGLPVDDAARALRNRVRERPPSGDIVVVGINDESTAKLGEWPWPRGVQAKLVDRLREAGAKRIVYDVLFTTQTNPRDDRLFAESLRRAGNVWLEATEKRNLITGTMTPQLPLPMFRKHVRLMSTKTLYGSLNMVRTLAYQPQASFGALSGGSAVLAGVEGPPGKRFRVDYAVDISRIWQTSAINVIEGRVPRAQLAGKSVIIAFSRTTTDRYAVPGRGLVNGAFIMIAGAETLKAGPQTDLGWLIPVIVTTLLAIAYLYVRRDWQRRTIGAVAVVAFVALPLLAEENRIFFDLAPSVLMFGAVAAWRAWASLRNSYQMRGDVHPLSGLPNLNALRRAPIADDAALVAARVRNYAEISAALSPDEERALVAQITGRLALGAAGATLYQGDEGVFMWVATPETAGGEHFEALHALFRSPALLDRRSIDLSVAFGVDAVEGREISNRIGACLAAADEAAAEGLRWKAFDPAKLADADWKLSLLGRLDTAIDNGEIWVAYQPQLEVATGRLSGAEALVRWSHPDKGDISPADFVLAAEQHDRIDKLTRFVLGEAISFAAQVNARGTPFDIAVNISARLLERPGLTAMVRELLDATRLNPERLTLEVTESAAMTSGRTAIRTLEELGSLGISVSIDDYGTGFSTLEYFKLIPAAEVKIDKSFIGAIDRNASDRLMVRSTIELAHSLGRSVVAEGVERSEVLAELTKLGCDKIQGYLIGKPMKAAMLSNLIADRRKSNAA